MIYTVTLNPAIDRTIFCDEINLKDVTRVSKTTKEAAGKGINVSKVIRSMGYESICTGFVGGENGEYIKNALDNLAIDTELINVNGNTRENIKVISKFNNQTLELNESGAIISENELDTIFRYFDEVLSDGDILVLAGSAPGNIHKSIYCDFINRYKPLGVFILLDTSKDLFKEGIKSKPNMIKPNLYELETYFGKTIQSYQEAIPYAKLLVEEGIDEVVVTLGKDGTLFVSKNEICKVDIPVIDVLGTVGAGDSFVAGYAIAKEQNYDVTKKLKFASSVSMASCLQPGSKPGVLEDANKLFNKIKVNKL